MFVSRLATCIAILALGFVTKTQRDRQKRELENYENIFGENAERLSRLNSLKRQVKDMAILNVWNAIFLFLLAICTLSHMVVYNETFSNVDISLRLIHSVASPIMTVSSQSDHRKALVRLFRSRVNVVGEENSPA